MAATCPQGKRCGVSCPSCGYCDFDLTLECLDACPPGQSCSNYCCGARTRCGPAGYCEPFCDDGGAANSADAGSDSDAARAAARVHEHECAVHTAHGSTRGQGQVQGWQRGARRGRADMP